MIPGLGHSEVVMKFTQIDGPLEIANWLVIPWKNGHVMGYKPMLTLLKKSAGPRSYPIDKWVNL